MKVLQVLYSGLGGHGNVAFSLLDQAARSQAWQGSLVFFGIEPVLPAYAAHCAQRSLPWQAVRTRRGAPWLAWPSLYRALQRARPDAIILHSVKAILPCAWYARRHGIPLLAVEHQANALKKPGEWAVSRWLMSRADAVVVLTSAYRAQLQAGLAGNWREDKVHTIANGVDTSVYAPGLRSGGATRRIGMAARLTGIKRHDLLIEALAQLRAAPGPVDWRLSLAGDGESLPGLRALVADRGLGGCVEFPGFLGDDALPGWFASLDVYAHASEGETLSTAVLQAMAAGLPIVASDVPGLGDLLRAGGGIGLPVAQEASAFAAAFQRLAQDAGLTLELGGKARAMAEAEYSQATMFNRYHALLESLCPR